MNKKILIVLGASLALNFLFIGFEVSRVIFEPPFPPPPAERFQFRPDRDEPRMQKDDKGMKVFFDSFKKATKEAKKPMEASKKAVLEALRSDPFNPEQLKKAMDEASVIRRQIDETVQNNMMEFIIKMSPEERAAFADGFEKGPKFGQKEGSKKFFGRRKGGEAAGRPDFDRFKNGPRHHPEMAHMMPPAPCDKMEMERMMPPAPCDKMARRGGFPEEMMPPPEEGMRPRRGAFEDIAKRRMKEDCPCVQGAPHEDCPAMRQKADCPCAKAAKNKKAKHRKKDGKSAPVLQEGSTPQK